MERFLYYSEMLAKQLDGLRRSGKRGDLAAKKCETIIADIEKFGCQHTSVLNKRTKNGELRIKNCTKYDLGGGYRLVTIRACGELFFCFVGTHDDAHEWLETHRYDELKPGNSQFRRRSVPLLSARDDQELQDEFCQIEHQDDDLYEEQLMGRIDEEHLKIIFQGLFQSAGGEQLRPEKSVHR